MFVEFCFSMFKYGIWKKNILRQILSHISDSTLQRSLLSVAIFQHHHLMEFTLNNSYVILEIVPSTVIF
jgi:hypothetical protein